MTIQREIAWRQHDMLEKSSIAYLFANYALSLKYEMLPADVAHQAKRCLLDTLGVAIGGYASPGRPICEDYVREVGGTPEATCFGSGMRTNAVNATMVNSFLVRYLDWNDMGGGGHNSDAISGVLAVAEREKATGRDFLTSVVITYELGARIAEAILDWKGWTGDTRSALTMPAALGKLMKLNADQIANAMGATAAGNFAMGILDTGGEERVMRKNLRFGWGACAAITFCMLAKKGFTGPVRIVEGERGLNDALFKGGVNFDKLTDFGGWRTRLVRFKHLCANASLQGLLGATLHVVREHDLKPDDIASVRIRMMPGASAIRPTVSIKYPRNAESADHSAFYLTAIAIKDREVTEDSIRPDQFTNPVVLELLEKITIEGDPAIPPQSKIKYTVGVGYDGKCEITTKDGRKFEKHVQIPKGYWGSEPLTDAELEAKFKGIASRHMDAAQMTKIIDAVWNVDKLNDMSELAKLMVFQPIKPRGG